MARLGRRVRGLAAVVYMHEARDYMTDLFYRSGVGKRKRSDGWSDRFSIWLRLRRQDGWFCANLDGLVWATTYWFGACEASVTLWGCRERGHKSHSS